jgi:TonB family protein
VLSPQRHKENLKEGSLFASATPWWIILWNLSPDIRMAKAKTKPELVVRSTVESSSEKGSGRGGSSGAKLLFRNRDKRGWVFLLLSVGILLAVLWWHWNRGWDDLESGLPTNEKTNNALQPQAHVPADVMAKLVTHRVDPDYPEAARPANLQGVVVLDVVVGRDGSVVNMHTVDGPEVLAEAAMDALQWWRFEPYRVDGQPVVVETTVAVEFKP